VASKWDAAYLRQAESDFRVFLLVKDREEVEACHKLHYLQMATEKLAKAFLSFRTQGRRQPSVHDVLILFVKATIKYAPVARAFRMASLSDYGEYVRQNILPVTAELQDLYPKGSEDKPNVEYPWEANGQLYTPTDYSFGNLEIGGDRMKKFVWYLKTCFVTADVW
jgi:hypothetical protein